MNIIVASEDRYLGETIVRIAREESFRPMRSANVEFLTKGLKKPDTCAIIDVAWEAVQEPGVLAQLVNVGRIVGNVVVCICPNQDEKLKTLAKRSGASGVFIRYDLEASFREYVRDLHGKK